MSKTKAIWNSIAGLGSIGLSVFAFVRTYQRYYECSDCNVTDVVIGLFLSVLLASIALWLFTLSYCYTYRLINNIERADRKFKFNGKSLEDSDRVFLKFVLYSETSPGIPTHILFFLKSGPWLCPYALWKDYIENAKDKKVETK